MITAEHVESKIFLIRGLKVMIDRDLAELYDVETKYLNRQVKRNRERFPEEFMFQLTLKEKNELVTNWHRFSSLKHSTVLPLAFTESRQVGTMLSSVLKSERAVKMSILIIKALVRLREIIATHKELAQKLHLLEMRVDKQDETIRSIIEAIRQLITPPDKPKRQMGFRVEEPKGKYIVRKRKA